MARWKRTLHCSIVKEIDNLELMAAALVRRGITFMRQDTPLKAITY